MVRRLCLSPSIRIAHPLQGLTLAWAGLLVAMLLALMWSRALWQTYRAWGLFQHGLGDDFANYYAQSRALVLWRSKRDLPSGRAAKGSLAARTVHDRRVGLSLCQCRAVSAALCLVVHTLYAATATARLRSCGRR